MTGPMRIAVLFKRLYMRHDAIRDRYGRLFELPAHLAYLGHDVLGICLSYRPRPSGEFVVPVEGTHLRWHSFDSGPALVTGLPCYLVRTVRLLREFDPHVIVSGSDALHVILGELLARQLGKPYVADLYDNFESFGLTHFPGVRPLYRRALRRASSVSAVSTTLTERLRSELSLTRLITVESTVDPSVFHPRSRVPARKRLGLPVDARLVSVAGALHPNRGVELVYEAFSRLAREDSSVRLVLAGTVDRRLGLPPSDKVMFLGKLPHRDMPWLFSACDVNVLPMIDSDFGRYAFPQKAYEILACQTPVVAARVGALEQTLGSYPECLYEPYCARDLAERIRHQLQQPSRVRVPIPSWRDQAGSLAEELAEVVRLHRQPFGLRPRTPGTPTDSP